MLECCLFVEWRRRLKLRIRKLKIKNFQEHETVLSLGALVALDLSTCRSPESAFTSCCRLALENLVFSENSHFNLMTIGINLIKKKLCKYLSFLPEIFQWGKSASSVLLASTTNQENFGAGFEEPKRWIMNVDAQNWKLIKRKWAGVANER